MKEDLGSYNRLSLFLRYILLKMKEKQIYQQQTNKRESTSNQRGSLKR